MICEETFHIISASILSARNEISAEMVLNGNMVCIQESDSKFQKGDRMNAVSVGYVSFSMHTHPLIAYCTALCNIGYPSGDDMRAWFSEAYKNNGIPTIHYCCTIEGTYIVRVRPLRLFEEFNITRFKSKLFQYFAAYHNARSTEDSSDSITPTQWVDICNTVTPILIDDGIKELEKRDIENGQLPNPNYYKTLFDCHFIPHVVQFDSREYCGDVRANCSKGIPGKSFWEAYNGLKVQQVCEIANRRQHSQSDEGSQQDARLGKVWMDERGVYTTDRNKKETGKYYLSQMSIDDYEDLIFEYEMYERILAVVKVKSKLSDLLQEGVSSDSKDSGGPVVSMMAELNPFDISRISDAVSRNSLLLDSKDSVGPVVSMMADLNPFDISRITVSRNSLLLEKLSNNSLNQAYNNILIGQWFFSTSHMSTWVVKENRVESVYKVSNGKEETMKSSALRLHFIKKKIKDMARIVNSDAGHEFSKGSAVSESHTQETKIEIKKLLQSVARNLAYYHHDRDFEVYEMPRTAPFVTGNSYEIKSTGHDGLNRPERVSYNFYKMLECAGIFTQKGNWRKCETNCQSKTVFLNLHKHHEEFDNLVIHELVHSALNDNIYFKDSNHTDPFNLVERQMKEFCKMKGITFYQMSGESLQKTQVYKRTDAKVRESLQTSMRYFTSRTQPRSIETIYGVS